MTVFEVSNNEAKEFFLCLSAKPLGELMREHCERPPAAIAHWKKNGGIFYGPVETLSAEKEARAFLEEYRAVLARTGWTVLP